jgi:cell division protease FtsH
VSEETQQKVDQEIRAILDRQYALARDLLERNRERVEVMTKALLEWETIDAEQISDIMAGLPPRPPKYGTQNRRTIDSGPVAPSATPPAAPA